MPEKVRHLLFLLATYLISSFFARGVEVFVGRVIFRLLETRDLSAAILLSGVLAPISWYAVYALITLLLLIKLFRMTSKGVLSAMLSLPLVFYIFLAGLFNLIGPPVG